MHSILLAFLFLIAPLHAKTSCEDSISTPARAIARHLIEKCEWGNGKVASEVHLAKICEFRKITMELAESIKKVEVINVFMKLPAQVSKSELNFHSEDEYEINCGFQGGECRVVKMSRVLDSSDVKLAQFSQSESEPFEAGQFRYHVLAGDKETTIVSPPIRGSSFQVRLGTSGDVVESMRGVTAKMKALGLVVKGIEFVHTHPYESLILTDEKGANRYILNLLSHEPPNHGDIGLADLFHELMPEVPFGITAVIGIEAGNLAKMSYWPK